MIYTLDLHFKDVSHAIGAFIVSTSAGPVLIETGPYSTFNALKKSVEETGFKLEDIKHVLLTHIHFDHAGAAWAIAEMGAKIYVHPAGYPHLAKPGKLYESAKMIYGDEMDSLWGAMNDISEDQLVSVNHEEKVIVGDHEFTALHTPGHAKHHIAWQLDQTIFTGDVAGVKIESGPVVPPCPPPDINLEDWFESIDIILKKDPASIHLTHFGKVENVGDHFEALKAILDDWANWMYGKWKKGLSADEITPQFTAYTMNQLAEQGVSEAGQKIYEAANPSWMSVAGLIRYWKKKQ